LAFSNDGLGLTSLGEDRFLRVWDAVTGRQGLRLEAGSAGLTFSPDGRTVAIASDGDKGVIQVRDVATGKEIRKLVGHRGVVRKLAFSADNRRLAVVSDPREQADLLNRAELTTWGLGSGKPILTGKNLQAEEAAVAVSADGGRLAVIGE